MFILLNQVFTFPCIAYIYLKRVSKNILVIPIFCLLTKIESVSCDWYMIQCKGLCNSVLNIVPDVCAPLELRNLRKEDLYVFEKYIDFAVPSI